MMEILSQPASFSMSLNTVIWKNTDTRQCRILQTQRRTTAILQFTDLTDGAVLFQRLSLGAALDTEARV